MFLRSSIFGGLVALVSPAAADDYPPFEDETVTDDADDSEPGAYSYAWREPRFRSGIGIGLMVGGGITAFTDDGLRDVLRSNIGGLWDMRASIGSHIPIGLDLSYLGSAASLKTLAGADNGTLIGTTVEGAIRYNILPHFAWNPYVFAGIGWQRYDVSDPDFATSDTGMRDRDDAIVYPMGAGLAYRSRSGLVLDVRGTFRAVTNNDLVLQPDGDQAELHSWEASAAIGYEL